jgi:hypothetical protein
MWSDPEDIKEIFETRALETDAVPQQIVIESRLDKMGGCYERQKEDFESYPTYYSKEHKTYIFHVRARRMWYIADEIKASKESLNSCTSDEVDLTRIPVSMWSNAIVRAFPLNDLGNRKVKMFQGATLKDAKAIQQNGFQPTDGQLGKAVYLFDEASIVMAKRQACEEFYRVGGKPGVALIECDVDIGQVFVTHESCSDSKWTTEGMSACWSSKTGAAHSKKWAIADPKKIQVVAVSDLRNDGCPWEEDEQKKKAPENCPFEKKTDVAASPWGGTCPCNQTGRAHKRHVKYADKTTVKKAVAMVAKEGGYPGSQAES